MSNQEPRARCAKKKWSDGSESLSPSRCCWWLQRKKKPLREGEPIPISIQLAKKNCSSLVSRQNHRTADSETGAYGDRLDKKWKWTKTVLVLVKR